MQYVLYYTPPTTTKFYIIAYKFFKINRSFSTQFSKFFCFDSRFSEFLFLFLYIVSWFPVSFLKYNGTRHDAFHVLEMSKASLPSFLLNKCFSNEPSSDSFGLFSSARNVAYFIQYSSTAALVKSVMSCCELMRLTECFTELP